MTYSEVLQLLLVHVDDAVAHSIQEVLRVGNDHQDARVAESSQAYNLRENATVAETKAGRVSHTARSRTYRERHSS